MVADRLAAAYSDADVLPADDLLHDSPGLARFTVLLLVDIGLCRYDKNGGKENLHRQKYFIFCKVYLS